MCQQALCDIEAILAENFEVQLEEHNFKNALKLEKLRFPHYRDFAAGVLLLPQPWRIDSLSTVASPDLLAKSRQEKMEAVGSTTRDTR